MTAFARDLRLAARNLARTPSFTAIAVATLALGIGFNTAVFSVVDAALFRPLPYPRPDELLKIWDTNPAKGFPRFSSSPPNFVDWREQNRTLSGMAAYTDDVATLLEGAEPERVDAEQVSPALFPLLGVRPLYGRTFDSEDEKPGRSHTVVLSWELWQRRFGGDRAIVGRTIRLDQSRPTVVGVMPRGFRFPSEGCDLWLPLVLDARALGLRVAFVSSGRPDEWRRIVGVAGDVHQYWVDRQPRPTFYVPLAQAPARDLFLLARTEADPAATLAAMRRSIGAIDPQQPVGETRTLAAVIGESAALVRIAASVLGTAALIALLLGAVGLFGLVSYAASRSTPEIGIRMALGARAADVLRSVVGAAARMALLGATIGLAGGWILTRALSSVLFGIAPGDASTLGAAAVLLLAAAAAACYLPARRATRIDPVQALRAE